MSRRIENERQKLWRKILPLLMLILISGQVIIAQSSYPRAGWVANIHPIYHNAQALVTIIDKDTLKVEHFSYDGTAPLVYFYLGATDNENDFQNGLQLDPLLDRAYNDESLTLALPDSETLDGYTAIAVWCAEFKVNFGSATFTDTTMTAIDEQMNTSGFSLQQNFPNPFNPVTIMTFSLPATEQVVLAIYGLTGRRVRLLLNEQMAPGQHKIQWSGRDEYGSRVASGVYLYRIRAGSFTDTKRMVLIK